MVVTENYMVWCGVASGGIPAPYKRQVLAFKDIWHLRRGEWAHSEVCGLLRP